MDSSIKAMAEHLAAAPLPDDAAAVVDELRALETLKCVAEARQARLAVRLSHQQEGAGGIAAQVALARRISPHRGQQVLSLATVLARELPHTQAAFDAGRISEWRATIIARETACLSLEHRAQVDQVVAADAALLESRGDREISALVRRLAASLDAGAVAARRRRAESERRVSVRPAPDSMVYLTALLPVAQGVSVYASLRRAADTAVGLGLATSRGQAMADALVRRATTESLSTGDPVPPVAVNLTLPAETLLIGADTPATLEGYGPIPAELARALVMDSLEAGHRVWLKRLFTRPETGELIAMDSRARLFPKSLADFIGIRDQRCRTPWCDAPIRHRDHIKAYESGGATSAANGQGTCEACNHAKQAPGWQAEPIPGERHTVETTTPTRHRYRSTAPAA